MCVSGVSGPGGLLKYDIMICKAATVTFIWNFSDNLQNYKKTDFMIEKKSILMVYMSNNTERFLVP